MNDRDLNDLEPDGVTVEPVEAADDAPLASRFRQGQPCLCGSVRHRPHPSASEVVAEELRAWFTERLTVDPGVTGPFQGLSVELLSAVLDSVRWLSLVLATAKTTLDARPRASLRAISFAVGLDLGVTRFVQDHLSVRST